MQKHGGDIYHNQVMYDYSVNINPFGMPEEVKEAAMSGVMQSTQYPDIECSALKCSIAEKEGIQESYIYCGNGAAEVIFQLVLAKRPKKALVLAPSFGEYEEALHVVDCEIIYHMLEEEQGFRLTASILEVIRKENGLDLIFLCNPNNPTGEVIDSDLVLQILEECKKNQTLLVMDECFQEFLMEEDQGSLISYVEETNDLFLLKAFTKMYGIPGLRLGYGITSNTSLLSKMKQQTQPWNVSIPAQMAGIAACKLDEFENRTRTYIKEEKIRIIQALQLSGCKIYGSRANYIFFQGPSGWYESFLKHGVLIRSCKSYKGLTDRYYRICIKLKEENDYFLEVLRKISKKVEN